MKPKRIAKKLFLGQAVLEKVISPINGEIYVTEDVLGARGISIGGLTQSGRIIEQIWGDGVKRLARKPKKILILGFGAGSAGWVVNRRFPKAKIVGVEIDIKIIELARKYFNLPKIKNLDLIVDDATLFVKESKKKFDLIMVDIYQGDKIPRKCQTDEFFEDIRSLLAPGGMAIFNHLYSHEEKKQAEKFRKKLGKVFPKVETVRSVANILFKV